MFLLVALIQIPDTPALLPTATLHSMELEGDYAHPGQVVWQPDPGLSSGKSSAMSKV